MTDTSIVSTPPERNEKLCSSCLTPIPSAAMVCKQCRNFQGGWWFWRIVGLGLPWIVAGLTVVSYLVTVFPKSPLDALNKVTEIVEDLSKERMSVLFVNSNSAPMIFEEFSGVSCIYDNHSDNDIQNIFLISGDPVVPASSSRVLMFDVSKSAIVNVRSAKNFSKCELYFDFKIGNDNFGNKFDINSEDFERISTGVVHHSGF